jgi:hypothetical protein
MSGFLPAPVPILHGPIYPITPVLHLSGVRPGYRLLATGSVSGLLIDYSYRESDERPLVDQWIPFNTIPKENEYIVVEQMVSFPAGGPYTSGPTPPDQRVQVQSLPQQLPPLQLSVPLHTCSDYIQLSDIIPGAWVFAKIENGPMLVTAQAMKGTEDKFYLDMNGPLPGGNYIEVWQSASKKDVPDRDSIHKSFPIQDSRYSNPLKALGYPDEVRLCYNEISLISMLEGAWIDVFAPSNNQWFPAINGNVDKYKFEGWFPRAIGPGEPFHAESTQSFKRCGLSSPPSKSFRIVQPGLLRTPKVDTPLCHQRSSVVITNLMPGGSLRIRRLVNGVAGRDSERFVDPIPTSSYEFIFPDTWGLVDAAGPVTFILQQFGRDGCTVESDPSSPITVIIGRPPGTNPDPPILNPKPHMYLCSNLLWVDKSAIGSSIQIRNSNGQTMLPRPVPVTESPTVIRLPNRLHSVKYSLWAEQTGCHMNFKSNTIEVVPYPEPTLPEPKIPESNTPMALDTQVFAKGLVPGARAYVVVDGDRRNIDGRHWSHEVDILYSDQFIPLNIPLEADRKVGVVQFLCGDTDVSPPPEGILIRKYKISLSTTLEDARFVRGSSHSFNVDCIDSARSSVNDGRWGPLSVEGVDRTCRCGFCPINNLAIAPNDPRTFLKVQLAASNINDASEIRVPIVDPPPAHFQFRVYSNAISWQVQHPQHGTLMAKLERLDLTVNVEYPADVRQKDVDAKSGSALVVLQNPERSLGDGWIKVEGSVKVSTYTLDSSQMRGSHETTVYMRFPRRFSDWSTGACIDFDIFFTYDANGAIRQWRGATGSVAGVIQGKTKSC